MALLPPFYINSVLALDQQVPDKDGKPTFQTVASGTVLGFATGDEEDGKPLYWIFLVTNEHVVQDADRLWAKTNKGGKAERYQLDLKDGSGKPVWETHDGHDIAVLSLNVDVLKKEGADFSFVPEDQLLLVDQIKERGVAAGDDLFVIGFPLSLSGTERTYATVKRGMVARFDDEILKEKKAYLMDSFVYPGNSGGPVAIKPSAMAIKGTKSLDSAHVVGIVSGYEPYIGTT